MRLQYPTINNTKVIQTEMKHRNNGNNGLVMIQMDLKISTEHFTQTQKNMTSSKHLMEPSPKLIIYSVIKQVSTDTKKLE